MRLKLHVRYVSSVCKYKLYVYVYYILGNVEYNIKLQKIVLFVDFECLLQAGKSMFNRGVVSRRDIFPDQCDQIFLEAITTSGHIKLLHWAKNYHGIYYQRISYFCILLHAMFAPKLQNCTDKADR